MYGTVGVVLDWSACATAVKVRVGQRESGKQELVFSGIRVLRQNSWDTQVGHNSSTSFFLFSLFVLSPLQLVLCIVKFSNIPMYNLFHMQKMGSTVKFKILI